MRRLIVNADDFGFTPDVNSGILQAHRQGILTSTTLMATGEAFAHAVALAHQTPSLDIGCHLVLVQGNSLLTGEPFPANPRALLAALIRKRINPYAELRAQIAKIVASGLRPTHLDAHKHTHIVPRVFRTVVRLASEFQIPFVRLPLDYTVPSATRFRWFYSAIARRGQVAVTDHFTGFRLTGTLDEQSLAQALRTLPEGTTELMCHPGLLGPELSAAQTRLKISRLRELEALTSPQIRRLISELGVRLSPFCAADCP